MANQVYFPQYKQIFDTDENQFILISHPSTQRAYKIKVSEILALADTIYTANGSLVADRTVDLNDNSLTFSGGTHFITEVTVENNLTSTLDDDTTFISITPTLADIKSSGVSGIGELNIADTEVSLSVDAGSGNVSILSISPTVSSLACTNGGDVSNFEQGADYTLITVNPVGANSTELSLDANHINISTTGTANLQINGSSGTAGNTLRTNGAGASPTWGKGILSSGTGTLTSGTVNISDTAVAASCKIIVTRTSVSGNTGVMGVTSKTNGVGFTVTSITAGGTSTATTDAGTFDYIITQ